MAVVTICHKVFKFDQSTVQCASEQWKKTKTSINIYITCLLLCLS